VPYGFYKIVVRESQDSDRSDVLAFLYPHHEPYKQKGPHEHLPYLVSVDYIEKLTGLDFLTVLPNNDEKAVERNFRKSNQRLPRLKNEHGKKKNYIRRP